MVEQFLEHWGYEVAGIADSGEEALRIAAAAPDLALTDIEIRGPMNGFEVAEVLGRKHDIPVIFLTGRADNATLERVRRSGSFGYILKPFRSQELKASIELAFTRHGQEALLKRNEQSLAAAINSTEDAVVLANVDATVAFSIRPPNV